MGPVPSARSALTSRARSFLILPGLLVLPLIALFNSGWDLRWGGAYVLAVNSLTYFSYRRDKIQAGEGAWRVSEKRLHLMELLGGWPAAYAAQRLLRHKSSKLSYRIVFWAIVLAWQLASIDALMDWRFSSGLLDSIDLILKSRES